MPSGHDYAHLVERWQELTARTTLQMDVLESTPEGLPIYVILNKGTSDHPIYLSAGVHGDECAPVWGLLEWAEENAETIREIPLVIFPCLNPGGLIENTRCDLSGNDLNRNFTNRSIKWVAAWLDLVSGQQFSRCLHLHEDYDSVGNYVYELSDRPGLGRRMLEACSEHIEIDTRSEIDGYPFDRGLLVQNKGDVRQEATSENLGGVEPYYLFLNQTDLAITFESPSEFDLHVRIKAHKTATETFINDWKQH